jgi:hypothetical protein
VAIVPDMLAEAYASHVPIKVLAMPVPIPPFDLRIYWHGRSIMMPRSVGFGTCSLSFSALEEPSPPVARVLAPLSLDKLPELSTPGVSICCAA